MERQGVEIDHCPNCRGVWLDRKYQEHGELDKIAGSKRSAIVTRHWDDPTIMAWHSPTNRARPAARTSHRSGWRRSTPGCNRPPG
jgi:Zn-finger nucleic acid-binding protein